jgi:polyprenyldihydroxybenzoate methyltransferase/3-demethylubiquinol 3-O-methyltransferase
MDVRALRTVVRRRSTLSELLGDCRASPGLFRGTTTREVDMSDMRQVGPFVGTTDHPFARRRSHTSSARDGKPSVNRSEAAKFARLSSRWWDLNGPFKPLHAMNKARCEFIKGAIDEYVEEHGGYHHGGALGDENGRQSTMGTVDSVDRRTDENRQNRQNRIIRVLDVGCGGGILSESLATMPMRDPNVELQVLGIDVNQEGIDTATEHRRTAHPRLPPSRLTYRAVTIEDLLSDDRTDHSASDAAGDPVIGAFDITIASEVIEHVDHPQEFCRNLIRATAPGGRVIVSTLNRTVESYTLAILGAEMLLRMVPEGTHDWSKFLTPEEVVLMMTENEPPAALDTVAGMVLNPLSGLWKLEDNIDVNYIASFTV